MLLSSITHFLLSYLAKNEQFTNETRSIRRRFQIICLIYMDFAIMFLNLIYCILIGTTMKNFKIYLNIVSCFPLLLASLVLIRLQRLNAAAGLLGVTFHITNLITSEICGFSFASLIALVVYPYSLLLVTSSLTVLLSNGIVCLIRFLFLSIKTFQIFRTTINEEQFIQVHSSMVMVLVIICSVSLISVLQKSMEFMVWSSTEERYLRSVNQTKEAIEAVEAKDRFISLISHEVRNPLNAIKGSIEYLGQMIKDKEQLKVLENAKVGGEILLNLVNNVLDAAKLKSDKIEIIYNETVFLDVLKKVLIVNSNLLKEKELKTRIYLEENLPRTLYIDPSRLLQVLMNLFSNAVKFTSRKGTIDIYVSLCSQEDELLTPIRKNASSERIPSSSSIIQRDLDTTIEEMSVIETESFIQKINMISKFQVKSMSDLNDSHHLSCSEDLWEIFGIRRRCSTSSSIRIDPDEDQGYLKVQISDNGCGISNEDKERLFGMFEQVTARSRLIQGGSGLGLWICKQLCQRMNGDITVYSTVGKGSSFVFYLPVNGARRLSSDETFCKLPTTLKALVVDKNPTSLYLHKFMLEQQGVRCGTACNAKEALEKYQGQGKEAFSFVFMDADLAEMSGMLAAWQIREWEIKNKLKPCEMYFVTECISEKELRRQFVKKGGNAKDVKRLSKSIGMEEMKLIVDEFKLKQSSL